MARRTAFVLLWTMAIVVSIAAARYFLDPVPLLRPPLPSWIPESPEVLVSREIQPWLLGNFRNLFLLHIGSGIAALLLGLQQFVERSRRARPAMHRRAGLLYCIAVALGGATGIPLAFVIRGSVPLEFRHHIVPLTAGFATLAVTWLGTTAAAFVRARQKRWPEHQRWMTRSYALTFAGVSTRLLAPVALAITRDVVLSVQLAVLSWPLNLVIAEMLIRRRNATAASAAMPGSSSNAPA